MRSKQISVATVEQFLGGVFGQDLHAKRVQSLAGATLGAMRSCSLAVSLIGQGLAWAYGLKSRAVARDGEGLARRAEMHVEAILGDVDADKARRGGGRLIHGPSLRMRARRLATTAPTTVRVPGWDDGRRPLLSGGLDHPRHPRATVRRQPRRLAAGGQLRDTRSCGALRW